ncbi:hypothetical protein INT45_003814 [Circinella minor]|uniref:BZIP domain-containing protein n=1 Tax=Circinella minor TaxID=1195481 RepID=A0A8H7SB73_9FUNG|nr:hypothetical protein INT45_003814 [Circinella minor]
MSTSTTITRNITKSSKKTVISHQEPKVTKQEQEENIKKMDDQLFQQFFQALASDPVPVSSSTTSTSLIDELQQQDPSWLSSPEWPFAMGTGQQSVHSTPEIATPQDMFLTSPTTEHVAFDKSGFTADLDVSALLSSSLFDVPQPQQEQVTSSVSTATVPAATSGGNDLHAALAALATVTQSPVQEQEQLKSTSPVIDVTPTFSTRKRKSDETSEYTHSPVDEAAIKRQKNTDAARRSRLRKAMKMDSLEKRVSELEKTNTTLLLRAAVLESEKSSLLAKETSYEQRIKTLEAQLAQAHHSLAGLGSSR